MIENIVKKLKDNGSTIAFAESITGGKLSAKLVEISGASKVFKGSVVAYSNEIKNRVLHINENDIKTYGVVSKEIALKMAQAIQKLYGTTYAIGVTGDAGPTVQENKEIRYAFYAICDVDQCLTYQINFNHESRVEAIDLVVKNIYEKLEILLKKS